MEAQRPSKAAAAQVGSRCKRRRRKVKKQESRKKASLNRGAILKDWADEKEIPRFSGKSLEDLERSFQKKPRSYAVPFHRLLRQRELGLAGNRRAWQLKMLTEPKDEHNAEIYEIRDTLPKDQFQTQWRKYARRSILFSQLATPPTVAVLAVECTGSYVLSLGGCDVNSTEYRGNRRRDDNGGDERLPVLTLKLYGEYSISRLLFFLLWPHTSH